jgi:hypothetical protein
MRMTDLSDPIRRRLRRGLDFRGRPPPLGLPGCTALHPRLNLTGRFEVDDSYLAGKEVEASGGAARRTRSPSSDAIVPWMALCDEPITPGELVADRPSACSAWFASTSSNTGSILLTRPAKRLCAAVRACGALWALTLSASQCPTPPRASMIQERAAYGAAIARYGDVQAVLARRLGQVSKGFERRVSLVRIRGVRVYVSGFVQRPGAHAVAGPYMAINAAMRDGSPTAAGSCRLMERRRGGRFAASCGGNGLAADEHTVQPSAGGSSGMTYEAPAPGQARGAQVRRGHIGRA